VRQLTHVLEIPNVGRGFKQAVVPPALNSPGDSNPQPLCPFQDMKKSVKALEFGNVADPSDIEDLPGFGDDCRRAEDISHRS